MDEKIVETNNGFIKWSDYTIEIDLDSIVKKVKGENFSGEFVFLDTKYVFVNGKGYEKKNLVNERLKEL